MIVNNIWLTRTCDDNKILYFVGWVRRGDDFEDKAISFDSRRNPPNKVLCLAIQFPPGIQESLIFLSPANFKAMLQTLPKVITFEEFVDWLPENSGVRYELHNGNIIAMAQPAGEHEEIKGFLTVKLSGIIDGLDLRYLIPNQAIVRPNGKNSGYFPDVLLLNRANLADEKLWKKEAILSKGASIPLVIEVVSTNWRDDYYLKFADYEEMGILEYWIVDYAALGGRNFIGNPKQPTISVCNLVDGEYQISKFRDSERLISQTFPELNFTANQIFHASVI